MTNEPRRNVYVGHRYVPKIMDEWDKSISYEGLSIVTYQGTSYTSKKHVPVGIDILNTEFWAVTGNYNAQVEQYRKEVRDMQDVVNDKMNETVDFVNSEIENVNNTLERTNKKIGVSYEDFGAILDGVTDDTEAIQQCHAYANLHGLPVVQRNSKFVLNDEVEVRTSTDLSGSTVYSTWVDNSIGEKRENTLYKIKGNDLIDITSQVSQIDFKKGATKIPSMHNIPNGTIIIKTNDIDMVREIQNDGRRFNVYKSESNIKASKDKLTYPLLFDYSNSTDFKVYLREFENKLTFISPNLEIESCKLKSLYSIERNNVDVIDGKVYEVGVAVTDIEPPIYTVGYIENSSFINITGLECERIGRERDIRLGDSSNGYLLLFQFSSMLRVNGVKNSNGWVGVDGNYYRDLLVENSQILSVDSHAHCYDIIVRNSTIFSQVRIHGGGLLLVENCEFPYQHDLTSCILTRNDYASEFDGTIRIINCRTEERQRLFTLVKVAYDAGRKVILPNVEIINPTMKKPSYTYRYITCAWDGLDGSYEVELPSFLIDGTNINESDSRHETFRCPYVLSNNSVYGTVKLDIRNVNKTTLHYPNDSDDTNIKLPDITNSNLKFIVNCENSQINLGLKGLSNIEVYANNCDIYSLHLLDDETPALNGNPFMYIIKNSNIFRPYTGLSLVNDNMINMTIENSKFLRDRRTASGDNAVGTVITRFIKYSKGNIREYGSIIPDDVEIVPYPDRLYDYIDNNYWLNN